MQIRHSFSCCSLPTCVLTVPSCIWIFYIKHGCIWRMIVKSFILLWSVTLTYFNNFLGFNEFDQICHKLSLLTGHHHSARGMISSELGKEKKKPYRIKQKPNLPNQYPKEKNSSETPGKTDTCLLILDCFVLHLWARNWLEFNYKQGGCYVCHKQWLFKAVKCSKITMAETHAIFVTNKES